MKLDLARRRLTRERARLESILEGLQEEQHAEGSEGNTLGDLSLIDQHPADIGSESFERDKDLSILFNVKAELAEIDRALRRVQDGTYGQCEACGRPIGAARLEARPAARFCLEDQAGVERQSRSA
jgi:RNA polymerase-binding transcription factor DksA